jgi:hypothetical protein
MSDDAQKPKKPSLSEISHLFLSSVRDRQTDGAQRPQRTPPKRSDISIDLTPEEFAQVYGNGHAAPEATRKPVPISAIVGGHLNGKQFDWVKKYARHRANAIGRVGLIEMDASELRLMCFDPAAPPESAEGDSLPECIEPRQMIESLEEMNWDVEQWLLLLPNPRTPEARELLREVEHWVLLSTSDHDGVVSSYRMLKGLVETNRPRLTLAVLDAADDAEGDRVYQKLSSVCQQFMAWTLEAEPPVQDANQINEHLVLLYRPTRDKAQMATAPQWTAVSEFLATAKAARHAPAPAMPPMAAGEEEGLADVGEPRHLVADVIIPTDSAPVAPAPVAPQAEVEHMDAPIPIPMPIAPVAATISPAPVGDDRSIDDVIDLPGHDMSGQTILEAVLKKAAGTLVECPLRPPMCVEARLAVGRDRGIVLLVAAKQGLSDLRSISQAYRWLMENRELICMALPQFAIDAKQTPRLRLLVDRADLTADALHPMLQSEHVTIQSYRKLRWGERLGVFLEAA